ncbi:MAG: TetR/AcrR family transcriptional regulator [Bacteroidota bacterium]|nr:TetR/AcrR family transcriptional regulator [Bacteroidota bacterium]
MNPNRKKMVNADLSEEKRMQIIDAAQKRFGMYGYEKTAVQEIARDLGISKALVYYYFPDKAKLLHDVIQKEQKEFFRVLEGQICITCDPTEKLNQYVSFRLEHFRSFVNLSKLRVEEYTRVIRPVMQDLINELREKDIEVVMNILELGIKQKQFVIPDLEGITNLFLEILRCLRHSVIRQKDFFMLSQEDYDLASKRVHQFLELFISGIINPELKLKKDRKSVI